LAVKAVSPGDTCRGRVFRGTWCLEARVPRQAVWRPIARGDSYVAPGDIVRQKCFAYFGGA